MLHLLERLFALRKIEHAVINGNWQILETSANLARLADRPEVVQIDRDIRLSFPELVGAEAALTAVLQQQQSHFELRTIARSGYLERPLYIDVHIIADTKDNSSDHSLEQPGDRSGDRLVMFVEDVSDRSLEEQRYVQSSHETRLLIQQLRQAETTLRIVQARFDAFMNHSPVVAFMKDQAGRYVYINQRFEQTFQLQRHWLEGKTDFDWLPPTTAQQVAANDRAVLEAGHPLEMLEMISSDESRPCYWLSFKFPFSSGEEQLIGGVSIDITERKRTEESLFQEKELAQVTLRSISDAVITTNATAAVQSLNPIAEQLTGWSQAEAQGLPVATVFQLINELTREPVENLAERALNERCQIKLSPNIILITRSGGELAIDASAAPIRDRHGAIVGVVMVFHDATSTRTLTRQLSWQATHDPLTKLLNRREFERQLEHALLGDQQQQTHVLCYLDLDCFKPINDTCGHAAGDELLRQIASLFQVHIRKQDVLARIGGDEFGILLRDCPLWQALSIANRLREEVNRFRFHWSNQVFAIGVSIGVVSLATESGNLAEVLSAADAACYIAKHQGRNRVHLYRSNDDGRC